MVGNSRSSVVRYVAVELRRSTHSRLNLLPKPPDGAAHGHGGARVQRVRTTCLNLVASLALPYTDGLTFD